MGDSTYETIKFMAFIGALFIAAGVTALGLSWFYVGFVFGVIIGGLLFQSPLRRNR